MRITQKFLSFGLCCLFCISFFGCKITEESMPAEEIETTVSQKTETSAAISNTVVTAETVITTEQVEQPEGAILFSCAEGIAFYDIGTNSYISLAGFEGIPEYGSMDWDNKKIYFTKASSVSASIGAAGLEMRSYEVYSMNKDGSEVIQLTTDGFEKGSISVSPLNEFLVYESYGTDDNETYWHKLVLVQKEKKVERVIMEWSDEMNETTSYSIWSPSGDQLAILVSPRLFLYDLTQDQLSQIVSDEYIIDQKIAWSPDQKNIVAGLYDFDKKKSDIGIINTQSIEIERIIPIDQHSPQGLSWSPDGKNVIYSYYFGSTEEDRKSELWSIEISDDNFSLLHTGEDSESVRNYQIAWSTDSKFIAYFVQSNRSSLSVPILIIQDSNSKKIFTRQIIPETMLCYGPQNIIWTYLQ